MQVQKQLSKKRGDKIYYRYTVNVPEELIKKAELEVGDELEGNAEKHKLILKKAEKSA